MEDFSGSVSRTRLDPALIATDNATPFGPPSLAKTNSADGDNGAGRQSSFLQVSVIATIGTPASGSIAIAAGDSLCFRSEWIARMDGCH